MTRCPYCLAGIVAGQPLCYTCGRFVEGAQGLPGRVAPRPSGRPGPAPVGSGMPRGYRSPGARSMRRSKRGGSKQYRKIVIVVVIAFVFLFTPAQDQLKRQLDHWLGELWDQVGPYHEYPVTTSYTLERTILLDNYDFSDREFTYRVPIPIQRSSLGAWSETFTYETGLKEPAPSLQMVKLMFVGANSATIGVPLLTTQHLEPEDAIDLGDGMTTVYWPVPGTGEDRCEFMRCVVWSGTMPARSTVQLVIRYVVLSHSYTWWKDGSVDSVVPGKELGMNVDNSGDFIDLERSGWVDYTHTNIGEVRQWYDRSFDPNWPDWAIDGDHSLVRTAADQITASLPADEQQNVFAFAHAAFMHVRDNVQYSYGLANPPRSGPTCLAHGLGDCDEQSNAWMSILRARSIPTWYEFGGLTDMDHTKWEPHAWSNALIPYDSSWCAARQIVLDTCFLEASVDVVNNKWMLHTPTSFTEWIEPASNEGEAAGEFYRPLNLNAAQFQWNMTWETVVGPVHSGGSYKVRLDML